MSALSGFVKSIGIYFLGNILSKLIMFLLLPVYTYYIEPDQLGYYDVANTYLNLIITFLFIDIYVGIMRFVFDVKEKNECFKPITNGLIIFSSSLVLYTLLGTLIYYFFDVKYYIYIYMYGICLVFNNLFGYLARTLKHSKLFAASGVLATFITCGFSILGLVYLRKGIEALYFAAIIGLFFQILLLEFRLGILRKISVSHFDRELLSAMFRYSLPLSLNSLAYWFLTGYSNVMISRMLSLEDNGLFLVAAKFGLVINLFSTCFNLAWQDIIFRKGNEDKIALSLFYSKAVNMLICFLGIGAFVLIYFSNLVFPCMVSEAYRSAFYLIPICIMSAILSMVSAFLGQIYAALKITNIIMYSTMLACLVNIVLVPLFIYLWNLQGATIAMVISYLVNVILRIFFIRKIVAIKMNLKILSIFILGIIVSLYVYFTGGPFWNFVMLLFVIVISIFVYKDYLKVVINFSLNKFKNNG